MKKNILVGITGSIAAYKVPELVKMLAGAGFNNKVVLTDFAHQFVTKLTLAAVSGNPVFASNAEKNGQIYHDNPMLHIELARFADLILVIPATANFIAKLAHGICDDLLSTICIASQAQVVVVPAMNQAMWSNPAVQSNLQNLTGYGIKVLKPVHGTQLCGETGVGNMLEINEVFSRINGLLSC